MRILFDVGHPGDFHVLKPLAHLLEQQGAEVLFTTREKEFEPQLIRSEGFRFENFGPHYKRLAGKIWGLLRYDLRMIWTGLRFRPDLFISHGSIYAAHAAFVLGRKHLSLEDTGNMEQIVLYRPFTDVILTPDVLPQDLGPKQIRYPGYHEIAYLHPEFFRPDPSVYGWLGLEEGEPYAIVRFVSWNATHDIGKKGLSGPEKSELVRRLSSQMKVFITSEAPLPAELEPYRFPIAPDRLHQALYHATIVVSEGATVASEAGVLGTPAVYINPIPISYCQDQEKYGLVYNTSEAGKVMALVDELLAQDRGEFRRRSQALLADKINVARYFFRFVMERYFSTIAVKAG